MMETDRIAQWLRDTGSMKAAEVVEACSVELKLADVLPSIDGGQDDVQYYNAVIQAPGYIFKHINNRLSREADDAENAIRGCAAGLGFEIRHIRWVPLVPTPISPAEPMVATAVSFLDSEQVRAAWLRALERRSSDPEGAITAARSFLESALKHLLEEVGIDYGTSWKLPRLYQLVVKDLDLAPSTQGNDALKRILGGCHTIVDGLAELRNRIGDAHGKGRSAMRITSSQAALAVNCAGAIAAFLIEKWLEKGQAVDLNE